MQVSKHVGSLFRLELNGLEAGMGGLAAPTSVCWCVKWGQGLEGPQVPLLGFPETSPDPRPHFLELQYQALLAGPSLRTWPFRCLSHFRGLLFPRCSRDTRHRCLPPTLPRGALGRCGGCPVFTQPLMKCQAGEMIYSAWDGWRHFNHSRGERAAA